MADQAVDHDGSSPSKFRVFFLGAGFSKAAGLPLASELLDPVREAARRHFSDGGLTILDDDIERYEQYLSDTDPSRPFDLEEFGAWLDWEHTLQLQGSETWSDQGNRSSLQLRWAIGHVLHTAMPGTLPDVYLEFARRLDTTDRVLTLNYDLVLERALAEVGKPYRRFPDRYSEISEGYSTVDPDQPDELVIHKLHGSLDWVTLPTGRRSQISALSLVEGPRQPDDPLSSIGVVTDLDGYYRDRHVWSSNPPLLLPPSTAKPLARSALVPFWWGLGDEWAGSQGTFVAIGCSLPPGDPYVRQVAHGYATGIGRSLDGDPEYRIVPQGRLKVVDLRVGRVAVNELRDRYRFMPEHHTDFIVDGFSLETLDQILAPRSTGVRSCDHGR